MGGGNLRWGGTKIKPHLTILGKEGSCTMPIMVATLKAYMEGLEGEGRLSDYHTSYAGLEKLTNPNGDAHFLY